MCKKALDLASILIVALISASCTNRNDAKFTAPAEFEKQDYIWLSWMESGFLGGDPFFHTAIDAMREITPSTKVRLFYGPQSGYDKEQMQSRIYSQLIKDGIDTSRVELFYNEIPYGAIQDPGAVFVRNKNGELAIVDFKFSHPDKRAEAIDRNIASKLNLTTISSDLISEGGAWQVNGLGTLLLVESVELDRNAGMSRKQIEDEYKRVLGVTNVIWLPNGLKEEEWGKLENGIYGIGTGGHIDEFCRFADAHTILLAEVSDEQRKASAISEKSYQRMEAVFRILSNAKDQDGNPFDIIRVPTADLMTKKVLYKDLSKIEQSWFDDVTTDSVEFYLTPGYLNLIIANDVVVTSKYGNDERAIAALSKAFPSRKIVLIDCMPLHHDGAGLHCHSRNQPVAKIPVNK